MAPEELGRVLSDMYHGAPERESTAMIQLFGIMYAEEIRNCGASVTEIVRLSGLSYSYPTEVYKGMRLARYVAPIPGRQIPHHSTTRSNTMKTKHKSRRFRRFLRANEAVSALEYALLTGVVAVGVGAAIVAFEEDITTALEQVGGNVTTTASITGAAALAPDTSTGN